MLQSQFKVNTVTEIFSYIKAIESPLSADVAFIKTKECTWIFDTGACLEARQAIEEIEGPKYVVISHFHEDHISNVPLIKYDRMFGGKNTAGYVPLTDIITERTAFDDIELIPVASSHAKGCLLMKAGRYLFLGDATYASEKNGMRCYNVQKLKEMLDTLKGIDAQYFCLSHDRRFIRPKESIILLLEHIYSKKKNNESWIYLTADHVITSCQTQLCFIPTY